VAWILQAFLALAIGGGGILKVTGDPVMIELFADVGAGQWLRVFVGTAELAGAVGLLIPRVRWLASAGLCVLLAGAAAINVTVLATTPIPPLIYGAIAGLILYLRRDESPIRSHRDKPSTGPGRSGGAMEAGDAPQRWAG